jgi:response regulator RpfG family c-di-GMP phosphodiesterase
MWSPTWVGERLLSEGVISEQQLRSAEDCMRLFNERIEEALLRTGALDENRLLRFVAERCRTQFVSTAKLARIEVPREALRFFSQRTAEKMLAFPVRWEPDIEALSVVSPDAGDPEYKKQVAIATGVKHLKAYVARPAAVRAAIGKWYQGQIQAFAEIATDTFTQIQNTQELYERRTLGEGGLVTRDPPAAPLQKNSTEYFKTPLPTSRQGPVPVHRKPISSRPPRATAPLLSELDEPLPAMTAPEPASAKAAHKPRPQRARSISTPPPVARESISPLDPRLRDLAELLNVLVALAESSRDEFRGHSSSVARFSRLMMQRMGLDDAAQAHAAMAANLHDLGKPVSYHLTALNVAQYAPHRNAAQKLVHTPVRLVETVGLPKEATSAAATMYERFDGTGFPSRLSGKGIPLGGRVLALCDTYSDLTLNPRNPFRRELSHDETYEVLSKYSGTVFDPDLVDLLNQLVVGEDLRRKLTDDKPLVLVVEPDAEEATILELRLVAAGFEVQVARKADQALRIASGGNVRYVLSETELEPFSGFELLSRLRRADATQDVPFLFVAKSSDAAAVERGFSLGANDYVVKPTSGDVLAGKLRRLKTNTTKSDVASGVAGSLSDMALPDLVQILFHSRKSGRLTIKSGGQEGEIHFSEGRIVHATVGSKRAEEAFYDLLAMQTGTFALDPSFAPSETTITQSPDMLVLEGIRRMDEASR